MSENNSITIGRYTLSPHPPIPNTNSINVVWIEKDDGEGMSVDIDKLWEGF